MGSLVWAVLEGRFVAYVPVEAAIAASSGSVDRVRFAGSCFRTAHDRVAVALGKHVVANVHADCSLLSRFPMLHQEALTDVVMDRPMNRPETNADYQFDHALTGCRCWTTNPTFVVGPQEPPS